MIYENGKFTLPMFGESDELRKLERLAELEAFHQAEAKVEFYMKHHGILTGDFYVEKEQQKKFGRLKTDRHKYYSDVDRFLKKTITNHNPHYINESLAKLFKRRLKFNVLKPEQHALWLTSFAYEFFFVEMPKKEIKYYKLSMNTPIKQMSDAEKSYLNLRKLFITLYAPVAAGQAAYDNNIYVTIRGKYSEKDFTKKYLNEYIKVCQSEGFLNYLPWNWVDFVGYIDPTVLDEQFNQYPLLCTFFVQLFSDDAEKILASGKYVLNKIDLSEDERRKGYKSTRDFYLEEFLPLVYKKIVTLLSLSNTQSNAGWGIYTAFSGASQALRKNNGVTKDSYLEKFNQYFGANIGWDNWYSEVVEKSNLFTYWKEGIKREDFYNPLSINQHAEDLLANTFIDKRDSRKRDNFEI